MPSENRRRLLELLREHARLHGGFTLSGGDKSDFYIDGKMLTTLPEGAYRVGKEIYDLLKGEGIDAIGGLTIGADPIVAAVAAVSYLEGRPIPAFMVRVQPKEHGTRKLIEGQLPAKKGCRVAIVDDVVTKGGSILRAIKAVEREGCTVAKVIVIVDRKEGGSERLASQYDFTALFEVNSAGEVVIAAPQPTAGLFEERLLRR